MSLTLSPQKSATYLSLLFIGAAGSLLGMNLLPLKAPLLLKQPVAQSALTLPGGTDSHYFVAEATSLSADSSTDPGMPEKSGGAGIILGLAIGAGAVGVALNTRKDRKPFSPSTSAGNSIRIEQASRKLQQKLLRLLHDDRDTANRLLSQVKMNNPYRAVDWCVEKVIYDLERDRGGY